MKELRVALLIDAENISHHYLSVMLDEVVKYGVLTIKRIYGDWSSPNLTGWRHVLQENPIITVNQLSYVSGKNSTDAAMIIDAMDLLYSEKVDIFFLASSDSDFTRLATRITEAGYQVYGMGEKKTPQAFIRACVKFIYLEVLKGDASTIISPAIFKEQTGNSSLKQISSIETLIYKTMDDLEDEDGFVNLADLGNVLIKIRPDFDPRNYGYRKLSEMISDMPDIEVEYRSSGGNAKLIFIRKIVSV